MRVRLTRDARDDLTGILEYIHERNPSGARNVLAAIDRSLDLISQQPHGAQATDHPAVRMKLVEVVHIRHAARRPWERQ